MQLLFLSISDRMPKSDHAFVNQGCVIEGEITNSVLFTGAKVGKGAKIIDSVLMPGVEVDENAVVTRALVADNVKIGAGAVVGERRERTYRAHVQTCKGGRIIWLKHLES